jgi:hypothetical protein
LIQFKTVY